MRQYRESLSRHGQVSPLFITDLVQPHLVGHSFADVGCGAGVPVSVMRARWPWTKAFIDERVTEPYFVGIDFSSRAVAYAERYGAYDRVVLADSSLLPLDDGEVDVSMSIENLEHLYRDDVVPALTELVRIARRRIVLTTPWPWDVVNVPWLTQELQDARLDPDPLGANEFRVLAGGVHKSTLLPEQLIAAGFTCMSITRRGTPRAHPVYVGEKSHVDLSAIGPVLGIDHVQISPCANDYRDAYVELIDASLRFREQTPRFKRGWYAALAVDRCRSAASRLH